MTLRIRCRKAKDFLVYELGIGMLKKDILLAKIHKVKKQTHLRAINTFFAALNALQGRVMEYD